MNFLASPTGAIVFILCTIVMVLFCVLFAGLAATSEYGDKVSRGVWVILAFLCQLSTGLFGLGATISIILNIIRYAKHA